MWDTEQKCNPNLTIRNQDSLNHCSFKEGVDVYQQANKLHSNWLPIPAHVWPLMDKVCNMLRSRWLQKFQASLHTCLVDVFRTTHFPFLCESRSMLAPSSSASSSGFISKIWNSWEIYKNSEPIVPNLCMQLYYILKTWNSENLRTLLGTQRYTGVHFNSTPEDIKICTPSK